MPTPDEFLTPRPCFLTPIPALNEAADLLGQAADCLLTGNLERAGDLIKQADMPAVRVYAASVMGRINNDIHRYRPVAGIPAIVAPADRAKARRLIDGEEMAIFARDGFHCRYCGCRVVVSKARIIMMSAVPDVLKWGRSDRDKSPVL